MRYLVVETNWDLAALARDLGDRGVLVTRTEDPEDVALDLSAVPADLMIAEAGPFGPGGQSLRHLRERHPGMAIALVARQSGQDRITECLSAGADTVIDASVAPDEMAARLMAVARRARGLATSELVHGPLTIDLDARKARIDEAWLPLTPKVYELLEYLALRPGA